MFLYSTQLGILKFLLCNLKDATQKLHLLYLKILVDILLQNSKQMKIEQVCGNKQRICIGILNRSLTEEIVIKKKSAFIFFVLETKGHTDIKHEMYTKEKRAFSKILKEKNTKRQFFKQI